MNSTVFKKRGYLPVNMVALSLSLLSCAESIPERSGQPDAGAGVNNRAVNVNSEIQQVFGQGFLAQPNGLGIPAFGFIGNTGGFGFSGSIASILGNSGGFGSFGDFGSFASFLAGSLPTTPPAGFIPPPGTGVTPIAGIPPTTGGGFGPAPGTIFGPPPGSFTGPGGNFTPPVGFAPPAAGFIPPASGFTPPASRLTAGLKNTISIAQANANSTQVNLVDSNLAETNSALSNTDLDFVFVAPRANTNLINPLAITETVTPCAGGGNSTITIDDVDPVGPSSGDSRTTTFTNCVRGIGGTILNGSRGFKTDSISGVPFVDPVWSTQTSMFQNNLTRDNTASGYIAKSNGTTSNGISVNETGITQNAKGSGEESRTNTVTNTANAHNYTFNVDFTWSNVTQDFSIEFNIDIKTTAIQNSFITVVTTQPMAGIAGASPTSGQVTITVGVNAVPATIRVLTAQADGTVLVESDTNADGVVDSTATVANWSDVLFELFNAPI